MSPTPDFGAPLAISLSGQTGHVGGRRWGSGPAALVFLHANGFCGSTYAPLLAPLAQGLAGHSVVSLDLRGHGLTTLPADPDRQDRWTIHRDDIASALDALPGGLAPGGAVLAGHSMGGTSALLAAGAGLVPGVRELVLFDPVFAPRAFYLYARAPWVFALWRRHFPMSAGALRRRREFGSRKAAAAGWQGRGAFRTWQPGFLDGYCQDGLRPLPAGGFTLSCAPEFEAACFAGQRHDPHGALQRLTIPLRVLRAAQHSTLRASQIPAFTRAGAQVETVAGASHFLPMEQPDLCRAALAAAIIPPPAP